MTDKTLADALLTVQGAIQNATKNAKNPHFKSSYADLNSVRDAVIPMMTEHGILVTQTTGFDSEGRFLMTTTLKMGAEAISASWPLPTDGTPQQQGSALTYARRYTLQTIAGIGAEDDDGNAASTKKVGEIRDFPTIKVLKEEWGKLRAVLVDVKTLEEFIRITNHAKTKDLLSNLKVVHPEWFAGKSTTVGEFEGVNAFLEHRSRELQDVSDEEMDALVGKAGGDKVNAG